MQSPVSYIVKIRISQSKLADSRFLSCLSKFQQYNIIQAIAIVCKNQTKGKNKIFRHQIFSNLLHGHYPCIATTCRTKG